MVIEKERALWDTMRADSLNPSQGDVPPGYKKTEVGVIPEDWDIQSLEHITDPNRSIRYGIVQVGPFTNNGISVLAIKNLNTNYIDNVHRSSLEIEKAYAKSRVHSGDILISVKGTTGRIGIVPKHFEGNISRDLARLSLTEKDIPEFWFQMLQSEDARQRLNLATVGTTRMEISIGILKQIIMARPPLPEQRAIAAALSDADGLIGALDALLEKKRGIKQAAMQQLLTGKKRLPGFEEEWDIKRLGEVGEISGAGVDKKSRPSEQPVRLVNYLDVYRRDFIYSRDLNHWVTAPTHQVSRCSVQLGDVFFTPSSETRDDIGVSAVAMEDIPNAVYSYHVVRLRLRDDWDLRFRTYAFKTREFLKQAETLCDGSGTRYVVSQNKFESMTVRVPPLPEQTAIAAVLSDMDAEIAALESRREKAQQIKRGMMQQLLTGRIRLVDPPEAAA